MLPWAPHSLSRLRKQMGQRFPVPILNLLFITISQNLASKRWCHPKDCRWFHVETGNYLKLVFCMVTNRCLIWLYFPRKCNASSAHLCTSCDIRAAMLTLGTVHTGVQEPRGWDELWPRADEPQRTPASKDTAAEELFGASLVETGGTGKGWCTPVYRAGRIWSQLRNKFRPRTEGRRKCSLLRAWSGELGWSHINMFTLSLFSNFFCMSMSSLYNEKDIFTTMKRTFLALFVIQHTWSYFLFFPLLSSFSLEVCVWVWAWVLVLGVGGRDRNRSEEIVK